MPVCTAARVQEKLADSHKSKCSRTDHKARSLTVTAKNIEHLWEVAPTIPKRKGVDLEPEQGLRAISSGGRGLRWQGPVGRQWCCAWEEGIRKA
ncbi:hypothetical protein G5714_023830 [Onychostoma macrolepis]|uniref:Uncharacterized protein n=1 Tax=Onychostoma macrolepis TaxID=369639 RepID=A0A7J6BM84_9TELE|nr:hypothetical protein G5714_023830 [Onychostoma macrolepis]